MPLNKKELPELFSRVLLSMREFEKEFDHTNYLFPHFEKRDRTLKHKILVGGDTRFSRFTSIAVNVATIAIPLNTMKSESMDKIAHEPEHFEHLRVPSKR